MSRIEWSELDIAVAHRIVGEVPLLAGVERTEYLDKGFSHDSKYVLWENGGPKFLLRVSEIEETARRRSEFELLTRHYRRGVLCSQPYEFAADEADQVRYSVLGYVPGVSATEVLRALSEERQFELGVVAGEQLRMLHAMPNSDPDFDWPTLRTTKYRRYAEAAKELALTFHRQDEVERFVDGNLPLLGGAPVVFQHDDYHPGNLIIDEGHFSGIIDFNRCDWGDPIEDFYKVPWFTCEVSVSFARGQVAGYFRDGVPDDFWLRYNLYVAMSIPGSLVWAHREGMSGFGERSNRILDTHDFTDGSPPTWYLDPQ